jgi:hypothetical protein
MQNMWNTRNYMNARTMWNATVIYIERKGLHTERKGKKWTAYHLQRPRKMTATSNSPIEL